MPLLVAEDGLFTKILGALFVIDWDLEDFDSASPKGQEEKSNKNEKRSKNKHADYTKQQVKSKIKFK